MMQLQIPKWIIITVLVISFVGFLDASYLAVNHFMGTIPPCTIGGCEIVTTSKYATIVGIPVALMGALYYLAIFLGTIAYTQSKNIQTLRRVAVFTIVGLIASIYFVVLQAFVIKAYCTYCLVSATTSTLLFVLGCMIVNYVRRIRNAYMESAEMENQNPQL